MSSKNDLRGNSRPKALFLLTAAAQTPFVQRFPRRLLPVKEVLGRLLAQGSHHLRMWH
jgi:hypothetical protein